ncbi:SepM family pheromone-processing serine protease [Aureibacillus halotolerans]|uniref:endopeptidase La n=1 Tax=Aureibacillus halotolerans TaxID=1508390 RepID=A0A4R6UBG4_9BACI|nr:SepM family pheromone-processing serine protease [Aureibacillus halotolerans]TDQ42309.1 PDZ domain-containing protein [Aureibacillus halotolerans]
MTEQRNRWLTKQRIVIITGIILVAVLYFYRLPYYLTMPGHAIELSPMIEVDDVRSEKEGELMLVTISMSTSETNLVEYALGKMKEYWSLYPADKLRMDGESNEEYNQRQLKLMDTSKESAIYVAFTAAGEDVSRTFLGAYVSYIEDGLPADGRLQIGDTLKAINGEPITKGDDLSRMITSIGADSDVTLTVERDGESIDVTMPIVVDEIAGEKKPMIGIGMTFDYDVQSDPDVHIKSESIGGPSAGLMFTLEIYSQLMHEDITKGRSIAGTGTMNFEGLVGPIGGIKQKVVAADNENADVFFAPVLGDNYSDAKETADDIGTDMEIVPVQTFDDALRYLEQMQSS